MKNFNSPLEAFNIGKTTPNAVLKQPIKDHQLHFAQAGQESRKIATQ
jgi:hypothetical protein